MADTGSGESRGETTWGRLFIAFGVPILLVVAFVVWGRTQGPAYSPPPRAPQTRAPLPPAKQAALDACYAKTEEIRQSYPDQLEGIVAQAGAVSSCMRAAGWDYPLPQFPDE